MMKECPCNGCTERKMFCHSHCNAYKTWSAEREAKNLERYRQKESTYTSHPKKMETIWKSMKRR